MSLCLVGGGSPQTLSIALGQRRFLIIRVDYFIKLVEVELLASIIEKQIKKFI